MSTPLWLNCGAGGNNLPHPWLNTDIQRTGREHLDITKPLPFSDGSARFVFAEHTVEHVSPAEAWRFFKEVRRILQPGGVFRIVVPSIERVYELSDRSYLEWMHKAGFGRPTKESAVENLIVNHGHLTIWSVPLLECCFLALGFKTATRCPIGQSAYSDLRGIEGHGKQIGEKNNLIESICVEASR